MQIFYNKNEKNIGIEKNLNVIIEMAKTKYAYILGDDDIPEPNAIETILNDLKNEPDLCVTKPFANIALKDSYTDPFTFFQDYGMVGLNGAMQLSTVIVNVKDYLKALHDKYYEENGKSRYDGTLHTYAGVILDYIMENYKNEKLYIKVIRDKIINIGIAEKCGLL